MKKLLLGLLLTAGAPGAAAAAPCDTADMLRAMSLATQPAPIVSPVTITPGMLIAFQGPGMRALHDSDVQARLAFRFRSYPNTTSIPPNPLLLSSFVTTSNYYFFGPDRINVRVPDSIPPGVTDVQIWVEFAPSLCPSGAQWAGFQ